MEDKIILRQILETPRPLPEEQKRPSYSTFRPVIFLYQKAGPPARYQEKPSL